MSTFTELRANVAKSWPFTTLPALDWSAQTPTYRGRRSGGDRRGAARARSAARAETGSPFAASSQITTKAYGFDGGRRADRGVARGRRRPAGGPAGVPASGRGPGDRAGGVRHAGLPVARSAAGGPSARRVEAVPGLRRRCAVLGSARRRRRRGAHRRPDRARAARASPQMAARRPARGDLRARDIVANRLDPWHGAWFHPYSFTQLEVLSAPPADDEPARRRWTASSSTSRSGIGKLGVPVIAEFTTPGPRTVVMRIVEGEGRGQRRRNPRHPTGSRARTGGRAPR